ncbi:MerR family transcriptional regulator [Veillonella criceti]|uniref:HTH-type transcriptional regulator AdhR n=1 Tax=Veillonella criceti TaxID=103891 RepID=A0A380NQ70_9FIRM|nr:MerR family transcriptional regulator [Veillonella criceti]SUP45036.1 HTH-type transcriptional regulator AdhR [Veillonella criceti]
MYTVKDVAKIFKLSVHTIRYYDDLGLIPYAKRSQANTRLFDDNDLEWIFMILVLRDTGMNLKKIKHYFDLYKKGDVTLSERLKLMQEQRDKTISQLNELQVQLDILNQKVNHYKNLSKGGAGTWNHEYIQSLIAKKKSTIT